MGVLGESSRVLFCEGEGSSLDQRLMSRLLDDTTSWTVVPARTKRGLARFAEGYFRRTGKAQWIAVRDRDLDQPPSDGPKLLTDPSHGRVFCLYRTEVENYLLDPVLISDWWLEAKGSGRPEFQNPESPDQIHARVERAAKGLIAYQAVRWGLATLRNQQPGRLQTTWTGPRLELPPPGSLTWDACIDAGKDLVRSHPAPMRPEELVRAAQAFRERFSDLAFWRDGGHLTWFKGKDIAKQMQRDDSNLFGVAKTFNTCVDRLNWQAHPDLVELAKLLRDQGGR